MFCEKCGSQLSQNAKFCSECGSPNPMYQEATVVQSVQQEAAPTPEFIAPTPVAVSVTPQQPTKPKKTNKLWLLIPVILLPVIAVVLIFAIIILAALGFSLGGSSYKNKMSDAYDKIVLAADVAENYCSLQSKVWYNCIYEKESWETDEYTQNSYGRFYDDFNDALSEFYTGESANYESVKSATQEIDALMIELKDCPSKYKDDYQSLKELYVAYSDLADLVIGDSTYSYNSFNAALEEAKSNYKSAESDARIAIG